MNTNLADYGVLDYADATFDLSDNTVWYKWAQKQIGRKIALLTWACFVQFRFIYILYHFIQMVFQVSE